MIDQKGFIFLWGVVKDMKYERMNSSSRISLLAQDENEVLHMVSSLSKTQDRLKTLEYP